MHIAYVARLPAGIPDHVAGVDHLEGGQLLDVGVDGGREAAQQAGPVPRRHRPPFLEGGGGPDDGGVGLLGGQALNGGEHLAGGWVADVHAVIFADDPPTGTSATPVQCQAVPQTETVQFNLAKAFDTLVETLADRECIVWRDRRLSYADLQRALPPPRLLPARPRPGRVPRARRPAGLGVGPGPRGPLPLQRQRVPRGDARLATRPASPRSTSTTATSARSCSTCSTTPGPKAMILHSSLAPTLAEVLPDAGLAPRGAAAGRRRIGPPPPPRGGLVRGGAGRVLARRAAGRARPPTTSTSSTPGARPACPRACCGARTTSSWPPWAGGRSARGRS